MSADIRAQRDIARATSAAIASATARLTGRKQRPHTDPVHRKSYDVDDPRARPWRKVGDGSRAQWQAHRNAVVRTCREQVMQDRIERYRGRDRLQPSDPLILEILLDHYNHATGELYPAHATIAAKSGMSLRLIPDSLARLRARGFLRWRRRTVAKEGAEGQAGPQREQTSNAYYFDWQRRMAKRTWLRLKQLLKAALRRLGVHAGAPVNRDWRAIENDDLRAVLARVEVLVPERE